MRSGWSHRGLLVSLAVAAGCGGGYSYVPDIAQREWIEVRSPSFVLRTDVRRDVAIAYVRRLEARRAALAVAYRSFLGVFVVPRHVTQVFHFDACGHVLPEQRGFVTTTADYRDENVIVTCEQSSRHIDETLLHETVHIFNRWTFERLPAWLQEGLAVYFSTLELEGDRITLGRPTTSDGVFFGRTVQMPTLEALRTATHGRFHYGYQEGVFYFASAALIRLLVALPDHGRERFGRYLQQIAASGDDERAWREAFAGIDVGDVDADLHLYATRIGVPSWHITMPPQGEVAEPSVTKMRAAEVHALFVHAQLIARRTGNPAPLLAQIDRITAEDPEWPDADLWRALVIKANTKAGDARVEPLLRAHLARQPRDERAWHALVNVELGGENPSSLADIDGALAKRPASLQADALSLARAAQTASGLNTAAWVFAMLRKPAVGIGLVRRALDLDPICSSCMDTLALLLVEDRRIEEGVLMQERAVSMAGEHEASKEMLARLRLFRELRERCRSQPADTHCPR